MDIYLTDEELQREENLFAPGENWYKPLEGEAFDVRLFAQQLTEGDNLPEPPSSC